MGDVIVSMFVTLDGVMEAPENWHLSFHNEEAQAFKHEELFASDALLLGRETYDTFAGAWPSRTDDSGFADRMNSIKKYVVSSTLTNPKWTNTTVINGDLPTEITRLKEQPGENILLTGSGQLVQGLMKHDLIDEYRLMVDPVVVGSGKRLFPEGSDTGALRLTDARTFGSGSVVLTYRPARTDGNESGTAEPA